MTGGDKTALVQRAIHGDRAAISDLFAQHRAQLRRMIAVRMDPRLTARFDPSDVVQDVLAEAAQRISKDLDGQADQFYPWLRQLAWDRLSHLHRHHVRTQKRSVRREADSWDGGLPDESVMKLADRIMASGTGPSRYAVREEVRRRVRTALADLPPADREVLVLRFLEQLSVNDTAAVLDVSTSAVRSRQFRALVRLEKMLADLQRDELP